MRSVRGRLTRATGAAALCLALWGPAAAQAAVSAARLSEGATLSSPVDGAFHDIGREGLTIEGWFYLEELPDVGEVQTLLANPSKYAVGVGIAGAFGSLSSDQGWWTTSRSIVGRGDRPGPPVKEWFHMGWQFHATPPDVAWLHVHEHTATLDGVARFPWTLADGDGALYIATPKLGQRGFHLGPGVDISGFRGLVDEVRVSSIRRYMGRGSVHPRHFRPDRHTVALWTFDGDHPYADSSGNGHHLIHTGTITVGPLAVEARGKLATTWAQLKGAGQ